MLDLSNQSFFDFKSTLSLEPKITSQSKLASQETIVLLNTCTLYKNALKKTVSGHACTKRLKKKKKKKVALTIIIYSVIQFAIKT